MPAKKGPIAKTKKKKAKKKTAKKKAAPVKERFKGLLPEKIARESLPEMQGEKIKRVRVAVSTETKKGVKLTEAQKDALRTKAINKRYIKPVIEKARFYNKETTRMYIRPAFEKLQAAHEMIKRLANTPIEETAKEIQQEIRASRKEVFRNKSPHARAGREMSHQAYAIQNAFNTITNQTANALHRPQYDLGATEAQLQRFFKEKINARYYSNRLYWSLDAFRLKYGKLCILMGPYECSFPVVLSGDFIIQVTTKGNAWTSGVKNHPHVKNSRLCKGESEKYLRDFIGAGLYMDAAQIIEKTLHTYYSGSPWITFDEIYLGQVADGIIEEQRTNQYKCDRCGYTSSLERRFTRCELCKRTVCFYNGCAAKCTPCNTTACKVCEKHNKITCMTCPKKACETSEHKLKKCPKCGIFRCDTCKTKQNQCPCCGYGRRTPATAKKVTAKRKEYGIQTASDAMKEALKQYDAKKSYYTTSASDETTTT